VEWESENESRRAMLMRPYLRNRNKIKVKEKLKVANFPLKKIGFKNALKNDL